MPEWAREILVGEPSAVRHLRVVESGSIIGDEFIDVP